MRREGGEIYMFQMFQLDLPNRSRSSFAAISSLWLYFWPWKSINRDLTIASSFWKANSFSLGSVSFKGTSSLSSVSSSNDVTYYGGKLARNEKRRGGRGQEIPKLTHIILVHSHHRVQCSYNNDALIFSKAWMDHPVLLKKQRHITVRPSKNEPKRTTALIQGRGGLNWYCIHSKHLGWLKGPPQDRKLPGNSSLGIDIGLQARTKLPYLWEWLPGILSGYLWRPQGGTVIAKEQSDVSRWAISQELAPKLRIASFNLSFSSKTKIIIKIKWSELWGR